MAAATAVIALFGCSASHEVDEAALKVPAAYLAASQAQGVPEALSRFTDKSECIRLKQMLVPRIRQSFEQRDTQFRKDLLGRDMSLQEVESLGPRAFCKAFFWRIQASGTDIQPPEIIAASQEGSIVTIVTRTRYENLDGQPTETEDRMQLRDSGEGYKMLLSPQIEAFARMMIER